MKTLTDIPGIGKTTLELLEAAGFRDIASLARAGVDPLTRELERANGMLNIAKRAPTRAAIEKWIRAAREAIGETVEPVEDEVSVMPVNFEELPSVASMLAKAPCAIPFPGRWLAESNIPVSEIKPGLLLNRYAGDLDIRVEDRLPGIRKPEPVARQTTNQYVQVADTTPAARLSIDTTKVRTSEEYAAANGNRRSRSSANRDPEENRRPTSLIRETLPETNVGKDPSTRRYIRGVLHSDPWGLRIGAIITLVLALWMPVAIIVSPLLLMQDGDPETFDWVRVWWLVFPIMLPLIGIAWFIWGHSCSCRICRQKLFVPQKHRKNAKAHHLPLIGYVLPLAVHLLCFQWFRCSHCGTPVRLKK